MSACPSIVCIRWLSRQLVDAWPSLLLLTFTVTVIGRFDWTSSSLILWSGTTVVVVAAWSLTTTDRREHLSAAAATGSTTTTSNIVTTTPSRSPTFTATLSGCPSSPDCQQQQQQQKLFVVPSAVAEESGNTMCGSGQHQLLGARSKMLARHGGNHRASGGSDQLLCSPTPSLSSASTTSGMTVDDTSSYMTGNYAGFIIHMNCVNLCYYWDERKCHFCRSTKS